MMEHLDLAWIERLGGWAAVLIVVRWMMSRMDRLIDQMQVSVDAFQRFQNDEADTHARLIDTQREILNQISNLKNSTVSDRIV